MKDYQRVGSRVCVWSSQTGVYSIEIVCKGLSEGPRSELLPPALVVRADGFCGSSAERCAGCSSRFEPSKDALQPRVGTSWTLGIFPRSPSPLAVSKTSYLSGFARWSSSSSGARVECFGPWRHSAKSACLDSRSKTSYFDFSFFYHRLAHTFPIRFDFTSLGYTGLLSKRSLKFANSTKIECDNQMHVSIYLLRLGTPIKF